MAHFYGKVSGSRGPGASRCGTADSGVKAMATGWNIGGKVDAFVPYANRFDTVDLSLTRGSNGFTEIAVCRARVKDDRTIEITSLSPEVFKLLAPRAWDQLFDVPEFVEQVRRRILPNLDKVGGAR